MKLLKLLSPVITACILIGTSNAAIAAGCKGGYIEGQELDSLNLDGKTCFVVNTIIDGDVKVKNSEGFFLIDSVVRGDVKVTQGDETYISRNTIGKDLTVDRMDHAIVVLNIVDGNTGILGNDKADVKGNVFLINLFCDNNRRLDELKNTVNGAKDCFR